MPLLSRHQTFALESCRDLLEKLDRELDRYREVAGRDEEDATALLDLVDRLKDSAFNAAVTAWHLCDWVFMLRSIKALRAHTYGLVRPRGRRRLGVLSVN